MAALNDLPVLVNYADCVGTYARAKKAPQEIFRSLNIISTWHNYH